VLISRPVFTMKALMPKFLVFVSLIASCSSRHAAPTVNPVSPIKSIAIVTGDPLAAPVGAELFNQGFRTFEVPANQDLTPKALQALSSRGVDGVLVVRSKKEGFDPLPVAASVRLFRTQTAGTVADFAWSRSTQTVPRNLTDIAREVVRTLLPSVPR
jgi:hypothetical protein